MTTEKRDKIMAKALQELETSEEEWLSAEEVTSNARQEELTKEGKGKKAATNEQRKKE